MSKKTEIEEYLLATNREGIKICLLIWMKMDFIQHHAVHNIIYAEKED